MWIADFVNVIVLTMQFVFMMVSLYSVCIAVLKKHLVLCPKGAIVALGGAITIKQEKCIGCGLCHSVCPIGAVTINEIGQATKCDLCADYDTQQCVEACPTHALTNDTEKIIHDKQEKISEGFKKVQSLLK